MQLRTRTGLPETPLHPPTNGLSAASQGRACASLLPDPSAPPRLLLAAMNRL